MKATTKLCCLFNVDNHCTKFDRPDPPEKYCRARCSEYTPVEVELPASPCTRHTWDDDWCLDLEHPDYSYNWLNRKTCSKNTCPLLN